jgi:hypothetical protein
LVHQQSVDLRSCKLQLNHAKLQLQALLSSERQARFDRDAIEFKLAEISQDKLLLEVSACL